VKPQEITPAQKNSNHSHYYFLIKLNQDVKIEKWLSAHGENRKWQVIFSTYSC
jgi:hypothetical protein